LEGGTHRTYEVTRQGTCYQEHSGQLRHAGSCQDRDLCADDAGAHQLHVVQDTDEPLRRAQRDRSARLLACERGVLVRNGRGIRYIGRTGDVLSGINEMASPIIKQIRAYTVRGGGADYHDQDKEHWIDDHIATPMSKYPEYRQSRQSFGINVLGTLVVEIEAADGTVGFAVTTGGEPAAFILEKQLARFLEGPHPSAVDK